MEVQEFSSIYTTGASWAFVQSALGGDGGGDRPPGFANVSSNMGDWRQLAREALSAAGQDPELWVDVVFASTRPVAPGVRKWRLKDGASPARIDDEIGGEWLLLLPSNVEWAKWWSSTSESSIEIELDVDDTWSVTGEFPVNNGERYEGVYFANLDAAIHAAPRNATVAATATDALRERRARFEGLAGPLLESMYHLDSFQDWYMETDGGVFTVSPPEEIAEAVRIATAAGWSPRVTRRQDVADWTGREAPVRVMEFIPPAGWDDDILERLDHLAGQWRGAGRNPAANPAACCVAALPMPED